MGGGISFIVFTISNTIEGHTSSTLGLVNFHSRNDDIVSIMVHYTRSRETSLFVVVDRNRYPRA